MVKRRNKIPASHHPFNIKHIALLLMFILSVSKTYSQIKNEFTYITNGLEDDNANTIENAAHLDDFFEQLYQLKTSLKGKINIIHLGDSHIQADYLTDVTRKNFQRDFGDAGRGFIIPGRVAGTNEPANIRTSSNITWQVKRCIYPLQPLPIGIGGITINTDQVDARLHIFMNDPLHDYSFNKIMLFFQKDIHSFQFSIRDTSNEEMACINTFTDEPFANYSSVQLPKRTNEITLQTIRSLEEQKQATLFGLSLENGNPGVLYHAIGVNGAKYSHYNQSLYFSRQTTGLTPDLFIISLGTNESVDYPYIDRNLYNNIAKLIESLKENNPAAKFILVTPPDGFRRKVKVNPGIELVRQQILSYAVENGLAFWDMNKAMGGKNSAQEWRKQGLLRLDGIHYTKEGYQYQGNLLYFALMKRYNEYVADRHP